MIRSTPVSFGVAAQMIGIAILIVAILFPMLLIATWALLAYFAPPAHGAAQFMDLAMIAIIIFAYVFVVSIAVSPVATVFLVNGHGGWLVALIFGAVASHMTFFLVLGLKESAYALDMMLTTTVPGLLAAGALWFCAELRRPV